MTDRLRWLPLGILIVAIFAVLAWAAMQPIDDMRASLVAFVAVSFLCLAAIPAAHIACDG